MLDRLPGTATRSRPTERDFAEAALRAAESGDVAVALEQVAAALSFDPASTSHHALLGA
jgi:hypothetical protein